MKRWAVITIGLYLAVALLLSGPLILAWYAREAKPVAETLRMFRDWRYWLWIGVSVVSQVLLLVVPVAVSERRPRGRRQLLVPVVTAAFLLAFVCVTALVALDAGIWGDHPRLTTLFGNKEEWGLAIALAYFVVAWALWGFAFRRFAATADPEALTRRLMRWLLRGSILELLIAVPSHVVARRRGDCCAPVFSSWGIATGITVMLLAFGPGVFFLFVERVRRKTRQGGAP
jgi:hypothetical protein